MSKLKKLNKLNKSKTLSVALAVGLVASNLVGVVPAFAATSASAHVMSISNKISSTSKLVNLLAPKDVVVSVTSQYDLNKITYRNVPLTEDDYTQDPDTKEVTINQSYFEGMTTGTKSLKFDFAGGSDRSLSVSVKNTPAKISTKSVSFTKSHKDTSVTVYTYGIPLESISNGDNVLTPDEDYVLGTPSSSGSVKVTLKKEYLSTLPNGEETLTFNFAVGNPTLTVKVSGYVPPAEATVKSVSPVTATTEVGTAPVLPGKVTVQMSTGPDEERDVEWAAFDESEYAEEGSFVVVGEVAGTTKTATATVTVTAVDPQVAIEAAAEVAVKDYEDAPVATLEDVTAAEALEVIANEKVALVTDTTKKDAFTAKIAAKKILVDAAKVALALPVVSSVSAITKTTVKVSLATGAVLTDADAAKFDVLAHGVSNVVKNVTRDLSDEANKTYTLTLTNTLDLNEGDLKVNGTAPATKVTAGSDFDFDYKAPTIVSVEALNATQLKVEFSEKMTKTTAEDILNYTISDPSAMVFGATTKALTTDSQATQSADQKSVVITLGTTDVPTGLAVSNFYLTINDGVGGAAAADLNGQAAGKTIVAFQGKATTDTTGPEVIKASYSKATGVLKLTFNEVVSLVDTDINEAKITVGGVTLNENEYTNAAPGTSSEVSITLSTSKVAVDAVVGNLTVALAEGAFKDAKTNASVVGSVVSTVSTSPVLQSASYDEKTNKLSLVFDKTVDVSTLSDLTKIQIKTNTGAYASIAGAVDTTIDGSTVVITPTTPSFRGTGLVTAANLKLSASAISDVVDNIANALTEVTLTYVDDAVAPKVISAAYQNVTHVLTLKFDETVIASSVTKGNIKLYDVDSSGVALSDAGTTVSATDSDTITVTLVGADITLIDSLDAASTKIEISSVTDITGNAMTAITEASATGFAVGVTDLIPPQLNTGSTDVVDATTVSVVFNEKVTSATANNIANYEIYLTSAPTQKLEVKSATLLANGTTVTLVTADQLANAGYTLKVTNVADLSGNVIFTTNTDTFTGSASANTAPTLSSAAFEDVDKNGSVSLGDKVTLAFSEAVKFVGTISEADFNLAVSTAPTFGTNATFAVKADDPTKVVVTLGASPALTVAGTKTTVDVKTANDIADMNGKVAAVSSGRVIQGDETAPGIDTAVYTDVDNSNSYNVGDTLVITYNEDVNVTAANLVDGSNVIDAFALTGLNAMGNATAEILNSKAVKITFGSTTVFGTFAVGQNVAYATASDSVYDLFATESNATAVAATAATTTGPVVTKAEFYDVTGDGANAGDRMLLTFSGNIQNATSAANLANDFALNAGSNLQLASGAVSRFENNKLALTLGTNAVIAANPTINITATANDVTITDVYGNKVLPATVAIPVTVASNSVAPTLSSVAWTDTDANGSASATDTLKFTFSETMDKNAFVIASDADILLGVPNGDFGASNTVAWNEAGTELTVTLAGSGISVTDGKAFNPTSSVVDVAGKADATAFAPTVTLAADTVAPVAAVLANLSIADTTVTGNAGAVEAGATVKIVGDGLASTTAALGSGSVVAIADGSFVAITGLSATTAYDVYVIDAAGNVSAKLDITTTA